MPAQNPDASQATSTPRTAKNNSSSLLSRFVFTLIIALALIWGRSTYSITSDSSKQATQPDISPSVKFMVQVLQKTGGKNICSPGGLIKGTCMDFEAVEAENKKISKILSKLTKTKFFRTIKVDLHKPCEFWASNDVCYGEGCSVEEIDNNTVPDQWKLKPSSESKVKIPFGFSNNNFNNNNNNKNNPTSGSGYAVVDDEFGKGEWVDLVDNPEKFTGYTGTSANQIWLSIYKHNCFGVTPFIQDPPPSSPSSPSSPFSQQLIYPPKQFKGLPFFLESLTNEDSSFTLKPSIPNEISMFYSIISGLHASTSTHICYDFFDKESNSRKPNLGCFIFRIGSFPQRLHNIYFDYVFVLRSIQKMSKYLKQYDFSSGDSRMDKKTSKLIHKFLRAVDNVHYPFDEKKLFNTESNAPLLDDVKSNFYNISKIMDCTACVSCKLWGKTQVLGLATGLKSLFSTPESYFNDHQDLVDIKRNEIVSLIATLNQMSQSLDYIGHFRQMYQDFIYEYSNCTQCDQK